MPSTGTTVSNVFQNQPGPLALSALDANFTVEDTGRNTLLNYSNYFHDTSGAPNSITVTVPSPLVFSYVEGVQLQVKLANTNTSPTVTINVNSLGATTVVMYNGGNPAIGGLLVGGIINLMYDGTFFRVISQSSSMVIGDGSVSAPSLSFALDSNTGIYRRAASTISFTCGGSLIADISPTLGVRAIGIGFSSIDGSAPAPSFSFSSDPDTGLFSIGANHMGFCAGGVLSAAMDTGRFRITDGSGGTPSLTFEADTSAGFYRQASGQVGIATGSASTVGAAGGASALPATPLGYIVLGINGTARKIPFYNI